MSACFCTGQCHRLGYYPVAGPPIRSVHEYVRDFNSDAQIEELRREVEALRQLADDLIDAGKRANFAALHDLAERAEEIRS